MIRLLKMLQEGACEQKFLTKECTQRGAPSKLPA